MRRNQQKKRFLEQPPCVHNIFKQKYKYFFNLSTQVPEENEKSTIKRPKVLLEIIVVKSRAKMTY